MKHKIQISPFDMVMVELPDVISDGQRFQARVNGKVLQVLWHQGSGLLQIVENDLERNIQLRSRNHISLDGEASSSVIAELITGSSYGIQSLEAQITPYVPGQEQRTLSKASKGKVIRSQMTGKILSILVKPGEKVETGHGLLIIEAMKMENRIFATSGGVIQSISVKVGDQVSIGKELIRFSS